MSVLKSIFHKFCLSVDKAYKSIKFVNTSPVRNNAHSKDYINNIYEIAFLKVFTAWEEFLEDAFVAYLTGAKTKRFKPNVYLRKISKEHALRILCGTLNYPDWTKIEDVYKLAQLYFVDGEPFLQPLQEIEIKFNEIKKVRNAIVHISRNSKEKFIGLAIARSPVYQRNMTPGEFLANNISANSRTTIFEHYISFLQIAAEKIIRI